MKLESVKNVRVEPWMNFYWYNVPDRPVSEAAFSPDLCLDLINIPDRLDRPFCIYKSNGPIKDLEQTEHSEDTVKYLNQKGLSIYLTEPICSYIDGWVPPNVHSTKHTMWFYSEFNKGEDIGKLRADELDSIKIYIEKNKLNNVTVHTGDYGIEFYYKYYLQYMNLITDDLFLKTIHDLYSVADFPEPIFSKKFICLNWRYTKHRHIMASYVSQLDSHVSWYYKTSLSDLTYKLWFPWTDLEQTAPKQYHKLLKGIQNLYNLSPLDVDLGISDLTEFKHHHFIEIWPKTEKFQPGETPNRDPRHSLREFYDDVFCDVVTETRFAQFTGNYSEKVYQAAVFLKPFILVGAPHSLEYAQGHGFKTFGDYWDESYDKEHNHAVRLGKILKIIDYIDSLPIDQLKDMYRSMKPILTHNRDLVYNKLIKHRLDPKFRLDLPRVKMEIL